MQLRRHRRHSSPAATPLAAARHVCHSVFTSCLSCPCGLSPLHILKGVYKDVVQWSLQAIYNRLNNQNDLRRWLARIDRVVVRELALDGRFDQGQLAITGRTVPDTEISDGSLARSQSFERRAAAPLRCGSSQRSAGALRSAVF